MKRSSIAVRYSRAFYELDTSKQTLSDRVQLLSNFQELYLAIPLLRRFLFSPTIETKEKEEVLRQILQVEKDPPILHFIFYLLEKGRLHLFPSIAREYRLLANQKMQRWEAELKTAVPIDEETKLRLKKKLEEVFHKDIVIQEKFEKGIIGGAYFVLANQMIDWTVKGRIQRMKEHLLSSHTKSDDT